MTKSKIQNKSKFQIPKQKFCYLLFVLCAYFVICALSFVISTNAYALNLDKLKGYFLSGDYAQAINEGEKILAGSTYSKGIDELYYLLGLSYLKDGNYLRASDIFEIILREFKNSAFREEAMLGLGDTYFLRGDFAKAKGYYKDLINKYPHTKLKAQLYYRLSQVGYKQSDIKQGKEYLDRLKQDFPLSPELRINRDLCLLSDFPDAYYTVQVGCFANIANAQNLAQKLAQAGYPVYMEELNLQGKTSYRVRVGKLRLRQEAMDLEKKLSYEGYPTKIYP
jgi:outer membrane protein assembly factor BamD (BamD/ComL family)